MDWGMIFAGVIALIGGFVLGAKAQSSSVRPQINEIMQSQAHDRFHYLGTLRREIANLLIWHNPDRFLQMYEDIISELQHVSDMKRDALKTRFDTLCEKYPQFLDFDAVGTKDYVLYPDAVDWKTTEYLEECYKDNLRFTYYATELVKSWQIFRHFRDPHLDHARCYVQRVKDTRLKEKMSRVIDLIEFAQVNFDVGYDLDFEASDFHVQRLHMKTPDSQIGIHLKNEEEHGIYSVFVDEKVFRNYYKSDPNFETKKPLNDVLDWFEIAH